MAEEVKKFVEEYNKRMSWNREILKKIKINYSKLNKHLQHFVDENLATQDISEEWIDLENAKVFEYGPEDSWAGTLEMQAFNKETYGTTYFWMKPIENEEEYKNNRISQIIKELDKEISDKEIKLKEVLSGYKALVKFRNKFNEKV